jgi:hypothetical protein
MQSSLNGSSKISKIMVVAVGEGTLLAVGGIIGEGVTVGD